MRLIAFVTASPLFAFEMNVPCQASPESKSSVRSGARARYAETWPASAAIPACWKLVAPLRTVSASRWPWMSSVWRSWMRSAGRGLLVACALGATADGVHATATARRRARSDLDRGLMRAVLQLVEPVVHAALREEVAVSSYLDDSTFVEHGDAVYVLDRREAVGDDDRGPPEHQLRERVLDQMLGLRVDRARGLVEHEQDLGVEGDGPAKGEELLLADGQRGSALGDHRFVALGKPLDELVRVHEAGRGADLLVADRRVVQPDVRRDRAREDERVLEHDADVPAHVALPQLADVNAVEEDAPLLHVVEARDEADDRGLPRPGGADDRYALARGDREVHLAEHPVALVVREAHVVEAHLAADVRELPRVRWADDRRGRVEQPEHGLRRRHGRLHDVVLLRQIEDRAEELLEELPEGEQRPDRHRAAEDPVRAGDEQRRRGARAREGDEGLEHAHRADHPLVRPEQVGVEIVEELERPALSVEELDDRHPRQVLVEVGVYAREADADRAERLPHDPAEVGREDDEDRQRAERHEREPPGEDQKRDRDPDEHEDVAEDRDDPALHHVRERVDVVRDPRHEPADRIPVEEAERQVLQVPEKGEPEVVHRLLADPRGEHALPVAEESRSDEHEEVDRAEEPEAREGLVRRERARGGRRDGRIDDELGDDRRGEPRDRKEQHHPQGEERQGLVLAEGADQAPRPARVVGLPEDLVLLEE